MSSLLFFLRSTPESKPANLNEIGLEGWPNRLRTGIEEAFADFRAEQIQLVLHDENGQFGDPTGTYFLEGGEEIFVADEANPNTPLWAGTIDPDGITRDTIAETVTVRVLQHGSLLNTVFAGMPDWTGDLTDPTFADPQQLWRMKGKTDNWKRVENTDGTFNHNEIEVEDTDVFYTPSAWNLLEDPLEKSKFAKSWLYHSATRTPFGIEEYPNHTENGNTVWTGPFKPHYRPDFNLANTEWDNDSSALIQTGGTFLRNSAGTKPYRTLPVADILADLVNQYNRSARFPLLFDPETDVVLSPPDLQQTVELLTRNPDVESIDLFPAPWTTTQLQGSLLVLINHHSDWTESPVRQFSVYRISPQIEVVQIADHQQVQFRMGSFRNTCFPDPHRYGFRFPRAGFTPGTLATISLYAMRWELVTDNNGQHYRFHGHRFRVTTADLIENRAFAGTENYISEDVNPNLPPEVQTARALAFNSTGGAPTGTLTEHAESPMLDSANISGRFYRAQNGGLAVQGILVDRFGLNYENTKIATIISDLAKATNSRWFITAGRRLKFQSRLVKSSETTLPAFSIERPFAYSTRYIEDPKIALPSSGLVTSEAFDKALETYYTDLAQSGQAKSIRITLDRTLITSPEIHQQVILPAEDRFTTDPLIVQETTLVGEEQIEILCQTPFSS